MSNPINNMDNIVFHQTVMHIQVTSSARESSARSAAKIMKRVKEAVPSPPPGPPPFSVQLRFGSTTWHYPGGFFWFWSPKKWNWGNEIVGCELVTCVLGVNLGLSHLHRDKTRGIKERTLMYVLGPNCPHRPGHGMRIYKLCLLAPSLTGSIICTLLEKRNICINCVYLCYKLTCMCVCTYCIYIYTHMHRYNHLPGRRHPKEEYGRNNQLQPSTNWKCPSSWTSTPSDCFL